MLFADLAAASREVRETTARSGKVARIAAALRAAAPGETAVAVHYLSGELRQRRTGLGPAALRELPAPSDRPELTVAEVDAVLQHVADAAGPGSAALRRRALADLFARATLDEQRMLGGLVGGELRQGALEGVMIDALARAGGAPVADVRRAVMLRGAAAPVADALLREGPAALGRFALQVGRPVQPMLASPAPDVAAALQRLGTAALEWKLDGVRLQVHRSGGDVAVFTRTLDEITARVPEVVEAALALPVRSIVLDSEAIALAEDGRPRPFQATGSRVGSRVDVARARVAVPLSVFAFDVLHLDGADLLGQDGASRHAALAAVVDEQQRVPRRVTSDPVSAREFFAATLARGHEGVVAKSLEAPYEAGRRGTGWLKVKPRHTLDLVVLAAEWGHGRRRGWLSNLHLGARDDEGFVLLGKTFKGLTDAMLGWQTERLLALATGPRDAWVVPVRPELVVEVAFDGVQTSPRYPGGMALRFARVLRHRPDKPAAEADTLATVRAVHTGQIPPLAPELG